MNYKHTLNLVWLVSLFSVFSCAAVQAASDLTPRIRAADSALPIIEPPAVIYVGELHDQFSYHLNQLAVISALRERGLNVAIGLEMIQTPFQQPLDQYTGGGIDFESMLEHTEYFKRWRYDARLYEPIFEYARQHQLPLVALNAPIELTDRVSNVGILGLDREDRAALPESLTPLAPRYRLLLEQVFEEHQKSGDTGVGLDRFIDVQRTWDETMAMKSAEFLSAHPDHILVVLAGVQHVAHGYGIPARVEKAVGLSGTIVLTENERQRLPHGADVFLEPGDETLPKSGRMGVLIDTSESGAVISGFTENSPAREAGAEKGDVIVQINGRPVNRFEHIKLALWDQLPGDPVQMEVRRAEGNVTKLSFELR